MLTPTRALAALALLALTATACEDADRSSVRRRAAPPTATRRASTPPAQRPAVRATPKPAATKPRAVTLVPTKKAAPKPAPQPTRAAAKPRPAAASTCGAPSNPWGYNFCGRGGVITRPPATFCTYFDCIDSFWENTNGYVMRCDDGEYSHSGGRRGSCSWHGGNDQPLYG